MPNYTGTDGNDTFTGTADNETISGGGGNDVLNGGDGNDTLDGGTGQDQLFGEGGDDTLVISTAPTPGEIYNGGTGVDTIRFLASAANFTTNLSGPAYNSGLTGVSLSSIERLEFGSIADASMTLSIQFGQVGAGLSATAEIAGGVGRDQLNIVVTAAGTYTLPSFTYTNWNYADEAFELGDVTILSVAGNGNFTLNAAAGHLGVQSLFGGSGNDTLNGTDGLEVLNGGGGVNTLNAGGGDDVLLAVNQFAANGSYSNLFFQDNVYNGGSGFDWLSVGGYVEFQGTLTSIEGINLQAEFSIVGGATQHEAELEIDWGAFDLIPANLNLRGIGTLSLRLGAGDVVDASGWVHAAGSNVFVQFFGSDDGGETVIGTSGNDRFSPSFGAGTFTGGAGNDLFEAGEGQATVTDFTIGQDRVDLQDMNITSWEQLQPYLSQQGTNVVFSRLYGGVAQTMTLVGVNLADLSADSFVFQGTDDPEDDTRIGTDEADELIGAGGDDHLEGRGGNDVLFGGDGNDTLDGGAGDDVLNGGAGNDSMTGGAGNDVYIFDADDNFFENPDEGTDELRTSIDWGLQDNFENITATGTGNIFLGGNALNNVITGNSGNNYMVGDAGNDTIDGGAGNDTASFQLPAGTTGTLRMVEGDGGLLLVQLVQDGGSFETVFQVAVSGSGSATVTGLGSRSALGTDTVANVEDLHFLVNHYPDPTPQNQFVSIRLAAFVPAVDGNNFAHVGGSVGDDVIDLAALYPAQAGTANINADGGLGNDTISGTDRTNWIEAGAGNDTLNGRGGNDTLIGAAGNDTLDGGSNQDQAQYILPASLSGTWLLVKNGDGSFSAMLTRNGVQEEAFRLTHTAGTWTVEGRNSASFLGTDTLTNVETVGFFFDGPFNNATALFIQLSPIVAQNGTQLGGIVDDVMDFSGFAGPVTVNANFGNDTVTGSNFNDSLSGGADNDTMSGQGGDDFLQGQQGDDVLTGGTGNDNLRGNAGNDQMSGGDGNDLLGGGAGVDTFDGGSTGEFYNFNGFGDRISFYDATATAGVVADLRTGEIDNDSFGNSETMIGIESLGGDTAFVDTFHGNDGSNTLLANRGDLLYGHGGNDDISLSSAAAVADGGDGDDLLTVTHTGGWLTPDVNSDGIAETVADATAGWTVNLGAGTTTDGYGNFGTVTNVENVSGSSLDDSLTGDGNANSLAGGYGDDTLVGGGGNDILSGDDILDFVNGVVTVVPTLSPEIGGDDFLDGGAGNDLLSGGVGDDQLRGRDGDDTLQGGTGNDLLGGGSGVDSYDGGTGGQDFSDNGYGDRISFYERTATAAVVADLRTGIISNDGFGNAETMTGIEALGADTAFADTFHGNDGTNVLFANRGDNLYGHGGDDYFSLTSAAAIVDGGDGTDRLTINVDDGWLAPDTDSDGLAELMAAATAGWSVNLTTGVITDGYGNVGAISNVENVEGSQLNDVIIGTDGDNVLEGGVGNDTLRGGEGDDALYGNDGNDFLAQTLGGAAYISTYGNDLYDGGDGSDRVSLYTESGPGVTVDLNVTTAQDTGAAGTDTFIGIEHITATYGDDHLTGTADTNFFWAFGGSDTLIGNGGDDYFVVGRQDKVIDGGSGVDTVDMTDDAFEPYYTADGITVSLLLQGTTQAVGTGTWTLSGIENLGGNYGSDDLTGDGNANILAGLQGDDILRGGGGNDVLSGDGYFDWDFVNNSQLFYADPDLEGGNDTLEGGAGNDTLYGGGGNDVLRGQVGNDLNYGGAGNDVMVVGAGGDDLYDGGAGSDRVSFFADTLGSVTVDLRIAGPQNTGRGNATFVGVEHVTGDYGNDTLTGNDATNWFWSFAGTDTLSGNGGDDYFTVGYGTKVIDGGTGNDVLEISDTAYVPMYTIENGVKISLELQGQAQQTGIGLFTLTNIENLSGGVGNDTFIGDGNANILAGFSGNDTLRGGGGNDFLSGDGTFELDQETGELVHRPSVDWAPAGNDTLEGGSGDDTLVGGGGNDSIDGGAGIDTAGFYIGDLPGTLSVVVVGNEKHILLTDGATVTHVATIFVVDGVLMVRGEGPAASLGTDSVVRVETLRFLTDNSDAFVAIDTGVVADGLVAGATVFMDANGNRVWDEGEARTITAADGSFSFLVPGSGPIIANGGYNTDTGLMNLVTLAAPQGSGVVNPITTLVQAVITQSGGSLSAAEASTQVATTLGLSAGIDLLNTDIYTAAGDGDADALEAQKAAAIIVTILVTADDAGGGGTAADVMQGLANVVLNAPPEGISLADEETIVEVLSNALPAETVNAIAADLALSAQAIDDAENSEGLSDAQAASLTTGNDLNNTLRGGVDDDVLDGRGGDDTLYGFEGDDLLDGGSGIDEMAGGYGDDDYIVDHVADLVLEPADSGGPWSYIGGFDRVWSSVTYTLGQNVEALVLTGAAALNGTGNGGDNDLMGNDAANELAGLDGDDFLFGAGGNDMLLGGDGNDVLQGGDGNDTLNGAAGNDRLTGGAGADTLRGGIGDDVYSVDESDTILENVGEGLDLVGSLQSYTLGENLENLTLAGTADINGAGNALNNWIIGNTGSNILSGLSGNDTLAGLEGNDVLTGGAGIDNLAGGAGLDRFVDTAAGLNGDTITDFSVGDRIVIADANLANFTFSLSGNTLTYSGGSVTINAPTVGTLVASAAAGGGVQIAIQVPFATESLAMAGFGYNLGWLSDDAYPRRVADVNGDGRADIVGFGETGVVVALATANGTFATEFSAFAGFGHSPSAGGWASDDRYPRLMADVNGDGRADIVAFGETSIYVALGQDNGTFAGAIVATGEFGRADSVGGWLSDDLYHRELGDVNGDGNADIVGFGQAGVYVALGQDNGTFAAAYTASNGFGTSAAAGGWASDTIYPRRLADVNGDGRDDIVAFGEGGTYVSLGQANGTFGQVSFSPGQFGRSNSGGGWTDNDTYYRELADVNGDGRADVVGFGYAGVYVALGQADGTLGIGQLVTNTFGAGPEAGGWNSQTIFPRHLADINHDGLADIVGFGANAVFVASVAHDYWL